MPYFHVTGCVQFDTTDDCGDDAAIVEEWIDEIVEADDDLSAWRAAAHQALESGRADMPEGCAPYDGEYDFGLWELDGLSSIEAMPADAEWFAREKENAEARAQMETHGCGWLFGAVGA